MGWFARFAGETSFHGLPDTVKASNVVGKVVWTTALLIAAFFFSLQMGELIRQYLNEETGTEMRSWAPHKIPPINFCPTNYLRDEKVLKNLELKNDVGDPLRAWTIASFMDSFLAVGSAFRMVQGRIDAQTGGQGNRMPRSAKTAQKFVRESSVYSKYNHSLSEFIKDSALSATDLFAGNIRVSPLQTSYNITQDLTWAGLCYAVDFDVDVLAMQLKFLQIDVAINIEKPSQDWRKNITESFAAGLFVDIDAQVDLRLGPKSHEGITGPATGSVEGGMEYTIDILPSRVERISLNRKKCRKYTDEEYLYCIVAYLSARCDNCKIMFPNERLSDFKNITECNYVLGNFEGTEHCIVQIHHAMKRSSDVHDTCPQPCVSEYYQLMMHPPKPMHESLQNQTKIHFLFRNIDLSVVQREYPLMSLATVFSNLGGTMGLYFGASLLSWIHLIYFLVTSWVSNKVSGRREKKRSQGSDEEESGGAGVWAE